MQTQMMKGRKVLKSQLKTVIMPQKLVRRFLEVNQVRSSLSMKMMMMRMMNRKERQKVKEKQKAWQMQMMGMGMVTRL